MLEVIFMLCAVAAPLILWALFLTGRGRIFWLITMTCCLTSVLIMELISKVNTGNSISQLFWIWSENRPLSAVAVLGLMLFGWLMLLTHLGWKLIRKHILKKS